LARFGLLPKTKSSIAKVAEEASVSNAGGVGVNLKDNGDGLKDNGDGLKENDVGLKDNGDGLKENDVGLKDNGVGVSLKDADDVKWLDAELARYD
jgi:hypothetical protein